jgi:uncharacterized protein YndB with AHSA1/START domain
MSSPPEEPPRSIMLEAEVAGTPEEVWEAIASGPGISSWLHPTEIDPEAGAFTFDMGAGEQAGRISAWEPPRRLVQESEWRPGSGAAPSTLASEWTVEARSGGTCIVRLVVSGFGSGASWEDELEGFRESMAQALRNLRLYQRDFRGRRGTRLAAFGRAHGSLEEAFTTFTTALGLPEASEGARVATAEHGAPQLSCAVEAVDTGAWRRDALLRVTEPAPGFAVLSVYGQSRWVGVQAYLFGDRAGELAAREQPRWQAWLDAHFPADDSR